MGMFLEDTCASNCFRRGDAEARITRFPRSALSTGRSRGRGARSEGGFAGVVIGCAATSYEGGASSGGTACLRSDIFEQFVD